MNLRSRLNVGTYPFFPRTLAITRSPALPGLPAACFAPDGGGGGGGAKTLADLLKDPDTKALIEAFAKDQNAALAGKRDEILGEKKKLQEQLDALQNKFKALDGLDIDVIKGLMDKLENDEDAKLIKAGKIDEVVEKKAARVIAKHEKAVSDAAEREKKEKDRADGFQSRWKSEKLDNAIARSVTGLADGALGKVQRDARDLFDIDDNGDVVPKENAPMGASGKPVTLETYGEYLLETSPFYFPASGGAGGGGGRPGGGAQPKKTIAWNDSNAIGQNLEGIASGDVGVR